MLRQWHDCLCASAQKIKTTAVMCASEQTRMLSTTQYAALIPWESLGNIIMLETVAIVLVILWLLGVVSSTSIGGFIHVLLVIAVIVILVRLIQGKKL